MFFCICLSPLNKNTRIFLLKDEYGYPWCHLSFLSWDRLILLICHISTQHDNGLPPDQSTRFLSVICSGVFFTSGLTPVSTVPGSLGQSTEVTFLLRRIKNHITLLFAFQRQPYRDMSFKMSSLIAPRDPILYFFIILINPKRRLL